MPPIRSVAVAVVLVLATAACAVPAVEAPSAEVVIHAPDHRPFLMGFTSWPYGFTDEAQAWTFDTIGEHADLLAFHLDEGIPWQEALDGSPFPGPVEEAFALWSDARESFDRLYVAATPQLNDRRTIAAYWPSDSPHADAWANRSLDDPEVIDAYLAYLRRIIDLLQPDYFAYGIEVNGGYTPDDPVLDQFETLAATVYPALKSEYPDLPVFLTFQTSAFDQPVEDALSTARRLLRYSDMIGVSTYPYFEPSGPIDPKQGIPDDWFRRMADLDPGKPLAVTETGWNAEDLDIPSLGVHVPGAPRWQEAYVQSMLEQLTALPTAFVIWWEIRDYDQGRAFLEHNGIWEDWFGIWQDVGLFDGDGDRRPALDVWDTWLDAQGPG